MCASPQREDGHLDIANELVEQLARLDLSGSEWRILWVVWRKTWAWHKKEDWISLSQFEKLTGLSRKGVCIAKKKLVNRCILLTTKNGLMFNKNYEQWVVNKMTPLVNKTGMGSVQNGNLLVNKMTHTKETITKETITKERGDKSPTPSLTDLVKPFIGKYSQSMIDNFLSYWTERNLNGKKERWQMERVFDPSRRLATWASREKPKSIIEMPKYE